MTIQEEIVADINWRNSELSELRVIIHKARLTTTQRETYIRYIVPAIYALWEGFVKNSLQLYAKAINKSNVPITKLHTNLLTHAITSNDKLKLDNPRKQFDTQKEFTLFLFEYIDQQFPINNTLPTKSNINSEIILDLLDRFNLGNISTQKQRQLDKLLKFRNTIAHGDNSIPVKEEHIDEFSQLIQDLMIDIFDKIDYAITNKTYLLPT